MTRALFATALLAQVADPLSGGGGWLGAGILGLVLGWLLLIHLPAKDKQIKEMTADKDGQLSAKDKLLREIIDTKDGQIRGLIEAKDNSITKMGEYHKAVVEAVVKNCDEQAKSERAGIDNRFKEFLAENKGQFKDLVAFLEKIFHSTREGVHAMRNLDQSVRLRTQLADAMQSLDQAAWTKTLDGVILSWNAAAERLLGWKPAEVTGQSIYDKIVPVDRHKEEGQVLAKVQAGEEVEEYASERLAKDRHRVRLILKTSPVLTREGRVVAVSTIARPDPNGD